MDGEMALERVKAIIPEPIVSYDIHTGWNIVLEINDEWIFRFSRPNREETDQLSVEKTFLTGFEKSSPLPVPKIEYEGQDYLGYRKLPGSPLSADAYRQLTADAQTAICESIGKFLTALHGTKFQHDELEEFPLWDDDFWGDVWKAVQPHLSKNAEQKAFRYLTDYFNNEPGFSIERTICHADFHPNHILFDPSKGEVTGIIDFGRLSVNDPAVDFNLLQRFYGDEAINAILLNYKPHVPENFRKRIGFQKIRRLFSAVYSAKSIGQEDSIPWYVKRIEDLFSDTRT